MFQGKWGLAQSFRLPLPPSLQMLLLQTTGGQMQVSLLMKIVCKNRKSRDSAKRLQRSSERERHNGKTYDK